MKAIALMIMLACSVSIGGCASSGFGTWTAKPSLSKSKPGPVNCGKACRDFLNR